MTMEDLKNLPLGARVVWAKNGCVGQGCHGVVKKVIAWDDDELLVIDDDAADQAEYVERAA